MGIERTLVLIKPDAIKRGLVGEVISELSGLGLKIVGAKVMKLTRDIIEKMYSHLLNHPDFERIANYMMGKFHDVDNVILFIYEGEDAIKKVREKVGATNPEDASPTSIRGKYGRVNSKTRDIENVIHCPATKEDANFEMKLFFPEGI